MGIENDVNFENNKIDDLSSEKITRFLDPPRRCIIFNTLAVREELSQGDLAKAVNSNATALANQLSKFDKFEYKLLESHNVGKYRYYKLSKLGKAYLKTIGRTSSSEFEGESNGEESLLLQEAEESIRELKELYDDKWKACFNKIVMRLVGGRGITLDEKGETLVKRYLRCVELLSLQGNHMILNSVLALISDDILQDDIEVFMEYFEPFIAVLNALERKKNIFEAYMLVRAAFCEGEEKSLESYLQAVEWSGSDFNKLKDKAQILKECVSEYSEEAVCRYFSYLLPDQEQLSIYIARCICGGR